MFAGGGRLLQFDCAIPDSVGGLARFLSRLSETKASIKDIVQQHPLLSDMNVVVVHLTIETNGDGHTKRIIDTMTAHGYTIVPTNANKFEKVSAAKL